MRKHLTCLVTVPALLLLASPLAAQDPKAIVEKAIKAHGGEANLTKYKATRAKAKGTISAMGIDVEFTVEAASQQPNKMRNELKLEIMGQALTVLQVYDGKKGWVSTQGQVMELEGDDLAEMQDQVFGDYLDSLVPLIRDPEIKLEAIADEKVDGKTALGIKVTAKGHKDVKMYFDKESGMLVKSQKRARDPGMQQVDAEAFYQDYKDVSGVKQAMKVLVKHDGKKFLTAEMTEIKLLEKLDDSIFTKP